MNCRSMKIQCDIYRCSKRPDTYLYLAVGKDQTELPMSLLSLLGELNAFLTLELTPDKKLAQANASDVMKAIEDTGFYLQMPPSVKHSL